MGKPKWGKRAYALCLVCAAAAIALRAQTDTTPHSGSTTPVVANETIASAAQTFTTLANFDGTNGRASLAALVQATDGNFYGTTQNGGASSSCALGCGTVFKITPGGTLTTLHSFDGTDGSLPADPLVQATDGNFYGTTQQGGANGGNGTVFQVTLAGTLTTLHSFDYADGAGPFAGLVQATDGDFYGTTGGGGSSIGCLGSPCGTVFKISPGGTLTALHSFDYADGSVPLGGLVQALSGNFYGTTHGGGANGGYGTVFQITPGGTLTTLHSFDLTDGAFLYGGLVQATDGDFYGTTLQGGAGSCAFGCGTVFKITSRGTLTTLHSFDGTDGSFPADPLVQASDGNFYGTTSGGGTYGYGTIFKITPEGTLTTLHSFDGTDGANPSAGLVQATNGPFYGTTGGGGASSICPVELNGGCGTVFSFDAGLGPFVETQPTSGWLGETVRILGTNLTGTTRVSFNGTAARFTVVSNSEITTDVPADATTGKVQVETPSGTLTSNVPFRVVPCPSCFSPESRGGERE